MSSASFNTEAQSPGLSSEASRAGFVTPTSLPRKADDLTTLGEQIAVDFAKAMEKRDIAGMLAARENLKILTRDIARLTVEVDAELLTHDIEVIKSRIGASAIRTVRISDNNSCAGWKNAPAPSR